MKKIMNVLWLVFLSVFPITALLEKVELDDARDPRPKN